MSADVDQVQAHYVSRGLVDDGWSTIVTNADE